MIVRSIIFGPPTHPALVDFVENRLLFLRDDGVLEIVDGSPVRVK